jgi:transcription elongation factor GreA
MEKVPMTRDGLTVLENELRKLRNIERLEIIRAIADAREHGDLKENAEYHAARERQSFVEGRITELEGVISCVDVIDPATLSGTMVRFGATVLLVDEDTNEERTYQIVGAYETDMAQGKISITSPMARALIGKELGDFIEVVAPGGIRGYEICGVMFK